MYSDIDVIRSNVLVRLTSGRNYQLLPEVRRPKTILLEITLARHKVNSG